MSVQRIKTLGKLDHVGATLSFACALHCLALPVVFTVLPLFGLSFLAHSAFEFTMLVLAVGLALASLCWGTRIHGQKHLFLFFIGALVFFSIAHSAEHSHDMSHGILMGLGGLSLAVGHFLNRRLCHTCATC